MFGWFKKTKSSEVMEERDVIDLGGAGSKVSENLETDTDQKRDLDSVEATTPETPQAESQQAETGGSSEIPEEELTQMTKDIIRMLKTVYDPEIPVDIYELGLIYKVDISDERLLTVDMTLTAPGCPVAGEMPGWVEGAVRGVDGVEDVLVNMTFDPPWTPERMSDEAKLELGWM